MSTLVPGAAEDGGAGPLHAKTRMGTRALGWPGHPLVAAVARRLALALPLLLIVSMFSFVLLSLTPGNAAYQLLGVNATPQNVANLEAQLGLDRPVYEQYWRWLQHAVHGDLGTSIFSGQPVAQAVEQRLPVSLWLIFGSLLVMLVVGVALGVFSAVRGGALGRLVDGLALLGFALPPFWLGAVMIEIFAVNLHALPAVGYVSPGTSVSGWLRSLAMPVIALALGGLATVLKQTREAMLDVLSSEHVRMAWANGIPARRIFFVYALKNVGIRIVTIMGLLVVALFGGTVFIETVFALPGLGAYAVNGASEQDIPIVQGVTLLFTVIIVVVNLLTDIAYTLLDPRARTS
jgi:peptide/nickel transport system permease protein